MKNCFSRSDSVELLLQNQQHIHENIKFADQKAAAVIGANTALLALVYSLIDNKDLCALSLGFLCCSLLTSSAGLAFLVVKPRGERIADMAQESSTQLEFLKFRWMVFMLE